MGYPLEEAAVILFGENNKQTGIEILKKSGELLDKYLKECKLDLLYTNVRETLISLSKKYKLFMVSNCKDGYIETFLHTQNLLNIFKDYECNGKTGLSKGENIQLIMRRNNIKNAIYVGDTLYDKESAEYAKIPFIYVTYGFGDVTEYENCIDNFEDLLKINN